MDMTPYLDAADISDDSRSRLRETLSRPRQTATGAVSLTNPMGGDTSQVDVASEYFRPMGSAAQMAEFKCYSQNAEDGIIFSLLGTTTRKSVELEAGFYAWCPTTRLWPPTLANAWVTAQHIKLRLRDWEPSWLEAMFAGGGAWEEV